MSGRRRARTSPSSTSRTISKVGQTGIAWTFSQRWPESWDLIEEALNKSSSTFHPDAASLMLRYVFIYLFIYLFPPLSSEFAFRPVGVGRPWPQAIVNKNPFFSVHTNPQTKAVALIFGRPIEGLAH